MQFDIGDSIIWCCPSDGKSAPREFPGRVESIDGSLAHIMVSENGVLFSRQITVLTNQLRSPGKRTDRPVSDIHDKVRGELLAKIAENSMP